MFNKLDAIEAIPEFAKNIHYEKENTDFQLYFHTIEPSQWSGAGSYVLSDIKMLDVTNDFMSLPEEIRGCQDSYKVEDCQLGQFIQYKKSFLNKFNSFVERLVEATVQKCKCIPLELLSHAKNGKETSICGKIGKQCYSKFLKRYNSCKIQCHGLYANVEFKNVSISGDIEEDGLETIMREYELYKNGFEKTFDFPDALQGINHLWEIHINNDKNILRISNEDKFEDCKYLHQKSNI